MGRHLKNVVDTLNPKGGKGLGQTVIVMSLIIAVTFLIYNEVNVPKEFLVAISSLIGYLIADSNNDEKEEVD